MMASPQWKPFQPPNNNHENATSFGSFGRSSTSSSFSSPFSSTKNLNKSNSSNNYNSSNSVLSGSATSNDLSSSPGASGGFREAGIVEKLLPSYGFIQCCERQARLFFHYSQFNGNIEHLKLGDPVEFEMTYDRRTGKPIASAVIKISSEAFIGEELSTDPVTGFITTEVTDDKEGRVAYENRGECFFLPFTKDDLEDPNLCLKARDRVNFHIATDKSGNLRARRISLETPTPERFEGVVCTLKDSFGFIERADVVKEIFFHSSECQDFKNLTLGDDVEFSVQTRNLKEVAVEVTRLTPGSVVFEDVSSEKLTGQILKTFERFGNHSHSRQHSISNSSGGTGSEPFPGKIWYKRSNNEAEISFGERDIKGEFTLQENDWVKFNIVTDRRDKLQHATNIDLFDQSFELSGEHREQGYITALKDSYGFIKCPARDGTRMYFKLSEMLDPNLPVKSNDEVEFTVAPDISSPGRYQAIRIKTLPNGTIFKSLVSPKQASQSSSQGSQNNLYNHRPSGQGYSEMNGYLGYGNSLDESYQNYEFPLIDLSIDTENQSSPSLCPNKSNPSQGFAKTDSWSEILSQLPITLDCKIPNGTMDDFIAQKPDFISEYEADYNYSSENRFSSESVNSVLTHLNHVTEEDCKITQNSNFDNDSRLSKTNSNAQNGTDARFSNSSYNSYPKNGLKNINNGFVAALKDTYGFIESLDHQTEIFFHYSVYDGNVQSLDLGQEVEYTASMKGGKLSAEYVKKLESGTIQLEETQNGVLTGIIKRSVRCLNPDQDEYPGLIEATSSNDLTSDSHNHKGQYEFSITSLADIHEFIQKGDEVTFQIGIMKGSGMKRAINVKPLRTKYEATVDAIKGNFGFLNYEVEEGKKLFFHMSEVKGDNTMLHPGDTVEFVVVHNQRNGKYSACSVVKLSETVNLKRPERLISRMKAVSLDENTGPKIILIRQPKGPDGSKGFIIPRRV